MTDALKRRAAKVLLPEPAGPHSTSSVLRGTLMIIGMNLFAFCIAMIALLWYNARAYVYLRCVRMRLMYSQSILQQKFTCTISDQDFTYFVSRLTFFLPAGKQQRETVY